MTHAESPQADQHSTPAPVVGRRGLLGAAAWSLPAVAMVGAAPAFAASPEVCAPMTLTHTPAWTATPSMTKGVDTGWYYRGRYSDNGAGNDYVSSTEAAWYDYLNLPDGSFLSFQNNRSGSTRTITLSYTFEVTGRAAIHLAGTVLFGYGNQAEGRTDRQLVDVFIDGLPEGSRNVAKLAPKRRDGAIYYPTASHTSSSTAGRATSYNLLAQTDEQVAAAGYTLHTPPAAASQGRFTANFGSAGVVVDDRTQTRQLTVRYLLTLPSVGNTWVNDDVVLYAPTVNTNC